MWSKNVQNHSVAHLASANPQLLANPVKLIAPRQIAEGLTSAAVMGAAGHDPWCGQRNEEI